MCFRSNYTEQNKVCFSTKLKQQFQTKQVVIRQVVMTAIYCLINHFAFGTYSRKVQAFLATVMAFGTNLVVLFCKALKTQYKKIPYQGSNPFQALPHRYRLENHLEENTAEEWAKTAIRKKETSLTEEVLIPWVKKTFQLPPKPYLDESKPSHFSEDSLRKLLKEAEVSGYRDTFLKQVDQTLLVLISQNNDYKNHTLIKITPEKIDEITDKWALFFRDIKTLNLKGKDVKVATQYMTYFIALSNEANFYETFENLKKIATHPDLPKKYFVYAVYLAASEICNPAFLSQKPKFSFINHPNWNQSSHKKEQFFYDYFAEALHNHWQSRIKSYLSPNLKDYSYNSCVQASCIFPMFIFFHSLQKNQICGNKNLFDKEIQPLLENLIGYFEAIGKLTQRFAAYHMNMSQLTNLIQDTSLNQSDEALTKFKENPTKCDFLLLDNLAFFKDLFLANIGKNFNPMQERASFDQPESISMKPKDYFQTTLKKIFYKQ